MSKRAEERALEAYPSEMRKAFELLPKDWNKPLRTAYVKGYEQAEKDLGLTIADLELLHTFLYAVKNNKQGCFTFTRLSDEQYQEVLRRFNERRNINDIR